MLVGGGEREAVAYHSVFASKQEKSEEGGSCSSIITFVHAIT